MAPHMNDHMWRQNICIHEIKLRKKSLNYTTEGLFLN